MVIITRMEAFFPDLDVNRLLPEDVRFMELTAEPLPDGQRIRTHLSLTPFRTPPLIELILTDPQGETCGGASIVEPMGWNLDLTLHIRTLEIKPGQYSLNAVLSYPELGDVDQRTVKMDIPVENQI